MDPQLFAALLGLAAVIVGSLGVIVKALTERIVNDLAHNTSITEETKAAANGTLTAALERLAAERNRSLALREIVREREDRIAYIVSRHPEVETTLAEYRERRTRRVTEREELQAENAILHEADTPQS